ncbi:MAG: hypothetical protein IJO29_05600 [Oscillospiraceae bacterium]|nr:hypothetical protein [Oscillospiraceae bacterium]
MESKNASYKVALGGVISSMSLFVMFLTSILPAFYIAFPMLAGGLLLVIVSDIGEGWAFVTYVGIGLLSLFITPDKEAALMFILLFGHYPILKQRIDRIKTAAIRVLLKIAVYNVCIVAIFKLSMFILGIDDMFVGFEFLGKYVVPVLLIVTTFVFLAYDKILSAYMFIYKDYFKPRFLGKR